MKNSLRCFKYHKRQIFEICELCAMLYFLTVIEQDISVSKNNNVASFMSKFMYRA